MNGRQLIEFTSLLVVSLALYAVFLPEASEVNIVFVFVFAGTYTICASINRLRGEK